jgi:hypothetical protein
LLSEVATSVLSSPGVCYEVDPQSLLMGSPSLVQPPHTEIARALGCLMKRNISVVLPGRFSKDAVLLLQSRQRLLMLALALKTMKSAADDIESTPSFLTPLNMGAASDPQAPLQICQSIVVLAYTSHDTDCKGP